MDSIGSGGMDQLTGSLGWLPFGLGKSCWVEKVGGFKAFLSLKDGDRLFRVHDRLSGQGIGTNIMNPLAMDNNNAEFADNQDPTHIAGCEVNLYLSLR